jgi:SET domain-containing protein
MKTTTKTNIRKTDPRFVVRRTSGKGLGLYALVAFGKKDFVIEYTGKKITTAVADTLTTRYLFEINKDWTIDGATRGNIARYINHSCDPNCEVEISEDDRIMISAIKKIEPPTELTYDYGEEYFDDFIKPVGCHCGTAKCRAPLKKK